MLRTVLADFRDFLIAPRLIVPVRAGWHPWAIMVALYMLGLVLIGVLVTVWQRAAHLPSAEAFGGFSAPVLALGVVLLAPVGEEVLFRGWLTGRPRALWLLGCGLIAAALLGPVTLHWHDQIASLGVIATAIAALAGWWRVRGRTTPPRWFARGFGAWFYLSVAVFGLLHLSNYPRLSWALLPMVLPQVWAGLVFGYLRMRQGLWAAVLAHATGNAAALATALVMSR